MKAHVYLGETVNIGRFGLLRKGDRVVLTDAEEHAIREDKRFQPWDEAKHGKILKMPTAPEGATDADKERLKSEEEARRSSVEKANDEWNTMKTELGQSSYAALADVVKLMNEQDKTSIVISAKTTKTELIRLICEAKRRLAEAKGKE